MNHTPTPFKVEINHLQDRRAEIMDNEGVRICIVDRLEDALPIVTACNAHDDLIKELQEIRKAISICQRGLEEACLGLIIARVNKALAKAGVKL